MFKIKRIYESYCESDGYRVLVDRIWPRGMSKETAAIDLWLKDSAPSTELRKWFAHEVTRWEEFRNRYGEELKCGESLRAVDTLFEIGREHAVVTLLFGARDETHNQAAVLLEVLEKRLG